MDRILVSSAVANCALTRAYTIDPAPHGNGATLFVRFYCVISRGEPLPWRAWRTPRAALDVNVSLRERRRALQGGRIGRRASVDAHDQDRGALRDRGDRLGAGLKAHGARGCTSARLGRGAVPARTWPDASCRRDVVGSAAELGPSTLGAPTSLAIGQSPTGLDLPVSALHHRVIEPRTKDRIAPDRGGDLFDGIARRSKTLSVMTTADHLSTEAIVSAAAAVRSSASFVPPSLRANRAGAEEHRTTHPAPRRLASPAWAQR